MANINGRVVIDSIIISIVGVININADEIIMAEITIIGSVDYYFDHIIKIRLYLLFN